VQPDFYQTFIKPWQAAMQGPRLVASQEATGYLIYLLVAVVFLGSGLAVSAWLRRRKGVAGGASVAYEGGEEPEGSPWVAWQPRFLVVALVFLVFEVELIFMFPLLLTLVGPYGLAALVSGVLFVVLLALGLVFAWLGGWLGWAAAQQKPEAGWQNLVPKAAYSHLLAAAAGNAKPILETKKSH